MDSRHCRRGLCCAPVIALWPSICRATLLLLLLSLAGCQSLGYYGQAVQGQWQLLQQRQSLSRLLQDPALPEQRRRELELVREVREFARTDLGLDVSGQYDSFVELERPFVVWNVLAAPEFSLQPRRWCFPVAGCVSYRGYFSEASARRYAAALAAQGLDTYVGGVTAYSTLGWFDDPVLSSMLRREQLELVAVLIHELAHAELYIAGDTDFNESFATTVEREGVRRWLERRVPVQERVAAELKARQVGERQTQFVALVQAAATDLEALYRAGSSAALLREQKRQRQQRLRADYLALKASWGGYSGYDAWFDGPLNNAQLGSVRAYHALVPDLQALLDSLHGDLPAFYRAARSLKPLSPTERRARLQPR